MSVSCLQTLLHKTADPVVVITRGEKCRMVFFCAKNYFVVLRQTRIGFKLEDRDPLRQMLLGSVVRTRAARAPSLVRAARALTLAARRQGAASFPPFLPPSFLFPPFPCVSGSPRRSMRGDLRTLFPPLSPPCPRRFTRLHRASRWRTVFFCHVCHVTGHRS